MERIEERAMTRVEFYHNAADRLEVARKLAAKAFAAGQCALLFTPDARLAAELDGSLWTWRQLSFLPHARCDHPLAGQTPVLIGTDAGPLASPDLLINLAEEAPACFGRFERVIEVVGVDEDDKRAARGRYRFYRERGYELKVIDLAEH
jgi:DNA polymerase-3 subunit chi